MSEIKLTPLRLEVLRAVADGKLRQYDRLTGSSTRMNGREVGGQCHWLAEAGLIKLDIASRSGFHVPWILTSSGEWRVQREGPWHE